ncbi:hypothetical protein [Winogradskyella endarachnes]|nr:hypothetical protein [Winogradskyella endarachnes]
MQIPRGSTSSYGNISNSNSIKDVALENVTARQRWSLPDGPKDTVAPF